MSRHRKFYGAMVLVSVAIFFIAHLLSRPPASYKAEVRPGPSGLRIEGVFRPGGWVEFEFSPGIESISGKYKANVVTQAFKADGQGGGMLWPEDARDVGRDWGGSMGGKPSLSTFKVKHRVAIPNEEHLKGAQVHFRLFYNVSYPVPAGAAPGVNRSYFTNTSERIDTSVNVELGDTTLSPAEVRWKESQGGFVDTLATLLALVSIGLFFFGLFRFAFPPEG